MTGGASSMPGDGCTRVVAADIEARLQPVAAVLVDGENVRRSVWPNIARSELERLVDAWAAAHGHEARVVWEGNTTADDRIAALVRSLPRPLWVVTSDRELRRRVEQHADRLVGGGSFARELQSESRS
jgi:hypothetical protein